MSIVEVLNDDGALVYLFKGWYPNHQQLHDELVERDTWSLLDFKMYGKTVPVPRRLMFLGDGSVSVHNYSKQDHQVTTWTDTDPVREILEKIKVDDAVVKLFDVLPKYNACLLNHYRDGSDSISMHADKEAKGITRSVISLSLGGSRLFKLSRYEGTKIVKGKTVKTVVEGGDLMIMLGKTNELYKHGIDKVKKEPEKVRSRISLTYREL